MSTGSTPVPATEVHVNTIVTRPVDSGYGRPVDDSHLREPEAVGARPTLAVVGGDGRCAALTKQNVPCKGYRTKTSRYCAGHMQVYDA